MLITNILFILAFFLITGVAYLLPQFIMPGNERSIIHFISRYFTNIPSMVILILPAIFLSLTTLGSKEIIRAFITPFSKEREIDIKISFRALHVFQIISRYLMAIGVLTSLIGIFMLLKSLDNPASIAPNISLAFITTIYSLIIAFLIFNIFERKLIVRLRSVSGGYETWLNIPLTFLLIALIAGLSSIAIFYLIYLGHLRYMRM